MRKSQRVVNRGIAEAFHHERLGGVVIVHAIEAMPDDSPHYRGFAYRVISTRESATGKMYSGVFVESEPPKRAQALATIVRELTDEPQPPTGNRN